MNTVYQFCLLQLLFLCSAECVSGLDCVQCDRARLWFSEEEHARHLENCQMGRITATPCSNQTHTHCIVSWFKRGDADRIVTERKCGTQADVTGCTLYNSKINRKVRHLLNNGKGTENRRESAPTFVEVCSESCPQGDCINTSSSLSILPVIFIFIHVFH